MTTNEKQTKILSLFKNYGKFILKLIVILIILFIFFIGGVKYNQLSNTIHNKNVNTSITTIIKGTDNMYNNGKNIIILDSTNKVNIVIDSTGWDKIFQLGSIRSLK